MDILEASYLMYLTSLFGIFVQPLQPFLEEFLPRAVYVIICGEFLTRFSVSGLRSILALYVQNFVMLPERTATIVYHSFVMMSCAAPLLGALLADGILGKFRTMICFSCVYLTGKVLMCAASTPLFKENFICFFLLALTLTSIGIGGYKPCSASFVWDQFRLPVQQESLERSYTIMHFVKNLSVVLAALVTPLLRHTVSCFGDTDCYLVAFCCTTLLFSLSQLLFIFGRPLYRLKPPKENVVLLLIKCASYALWKKLHSKHRAKAHWLDYAAKKYDLQLIEDMKVMFSVMLIFVPLPLFWCLFDQQGSKWIFQVSRMDCNMLGTCLMPDQVQVISPALVLILILIYKKTVLPITRRNCSSSNLWGLAIGGFIAGLAFMAAGIVELNLEVSYSSFPCKEKAYLNVINKLPCRIDVGNPLNHFQQIESHRNYIFRNITTEHEQKSLYIMIAATQVCGGITFDTCWSFLDVSVTEGQVSTLVIMEEEQDLSTYILEPEILQKYMSREPRLR